MRAPSETGHRRQDGSRGRRAPEVSLSAQQRVALLDRLSHAELPPRDAIRIRLALMAADGLTTTAIASVLNLSRPTVTLWRRRLALEGVEGLVDRPRSGRPSRIGDEQRKQLMDLQRELQASGVQANVTLQDVCERARQRGIVDAISRSHLQRILRAQEVE